MTNYEKIKLMSIEGMADFLGYFNPEEMICRRVNPNMGDSFCRLHDCTNCAREYLESEAEGITLKEAVDNFRKQWNWIADETERQGRKIEKDKYFRAHHIIRGRPINDCYLCEFSKDLLCDECPIEWGGNIGYCTNRRDDTADNKNLYCQWFIATDWKKAARLAREIAELPLKERYKEEYENEQKVD